MGQPSASHAQQASGRSGRSGRKRLWTQEALDALDARCERPERPLANWAWDASSPKLMLLPTKEDQSSYIRECDASFRFVDGDTWKQKLRTANLTPKPQPTPCPRHCNTADSSVECVPNHSSLCSTPCFGKHIPYGRQPACWTQHADARTGHAPARTLLLTPVLLQLIFFSLTSSLSPHLTWDPLL